MIRWRRARVCALLGVLLSLLNAVSAPILAAVPPPLQDVARDHFDPNQGVFAQSESGAILAALNPDRMFHPASVTKVATTLAFLRQWSPGRRLRTRLSATGPVQNGTLNGNLLIEAQGDPYFVFENAFLVLGELNRRGIRRIDGRVRVQGTFFFNWNLDVQGRRLQRALAGRDGVGRWRDLQLHGKAISDVRLADVALKFSNRERKNGHEAKTLLIHESAPLRRILKEFNGYSNNIFHIFSNGIGGPRKIEKITRSSVPELVRGQVRIDNAAGGGRTNRLSPRAAVAVLRELDRELGADGLGLSAVLPVAGVDRGTLERRLETPASRDSVVGKTGTLPSIAVSTLAGVVYTKRFGKVFFAIMNRGIPVWRARKNQDAFIRSLLKRAEPLPLRYRPASGPAFTEARITPASPR